MYAKLEPGFSECLPGWMAAGWGAAIRSMQLVFLPLWHMVVPWRCSLQRASAIGSGRQPPVPVRVTPALLRGHCRRPPHSSQAWSSEGPPGCSERQNHLMCYKQSKQWFKWLGSQQCAPLQLLSQWKAWQKKFDIKLGVITRLRWPADSKVQNKTVASCNVAHQLLTEKYISY